MDVKDIRAIAQTSTSMYFIAKPKLEDYVYKLPAGDNSNNILPFYKHSYIKKIKTSKRDVSLDNILSINANSSITYLNLCKCNINDEKLKLLCQSISQHGNLQSLKLSGNNVTNKGALAIAQTINQNKSLVVLDISYNEIKFKGSKAIIQNIKKNAFFQKLDFSNNQISPKGFKILGEILQHSAHFKSFSFSRHMALGYIKHKGIKAFALGLAKNTSLEELYLNNHKMTIEEINSLLKPLSSHNNIRIFSLRDSFVHDDNMPYLQALIENNNNLEKLYITGGYLSDFNRYQIYHLNCKKPHLEIHY